MKSHIWWREKDSYGSLSFTPFSNVLHACLILRLIEVEVKVLESARQPAKATSVDLTVKKSEDESYCTLLKPLKKSILPYTSDIIFPDPEIIVKIDFFLWLVSKVFHSLEVKENFQSHSHSAVTGKKLLNPHSYSREEQTIQEH